MMITTTVRQRPLRLAAALLAASCHLVGAAATPDVDAQELHFSGFGTVGLVHSNASAGVGFRRDVSERPNNGGTRADIDTRLGLQANYRASSEFEFVGQLLGANRVAAAPAGDLVSMAFVAWRPRDDITLRAGRLSADYFLLADYRNVGLAYPFVRPSTETYAALPYALDGVDLTKAWDIDDAVWKLRGIIGRSHASADEPSRTFAFRPSYSVVLSREDADGLRLKASASRLWLRVDETASRPLLDGLGLVASLPAQDVAAQAEGFVNAIAVNGTAVTYFALGAAFDRDSWLVDLEIARCVNRSGPYTVAWGIVGHRWGSLTAYGGLSAIRTERSRVAPQWEAALTPLLGAAGAAQAQQLGMFAFTGVSVANASQRTATLGLRWDLSDRTALKLQWDRVRVDAYGRRLWSGPATPDAINASIYSATLDFVF